MKVLYTSIVLAAFTATASGQSAIDRYLSGPLTYTTVVDIGDTVYQPTDLGFKPNTNELWVLNRGMDSNGGSFIIVHDAGMPDQVSQYRKDSHSGHFMTYASSMAWSDNGEWAGVSEVQSTASPTSTFMGPALWLGDLNIFARVFQSNWVSGYPLGSHVDMLHQSPFAMGIAADSAKVYWVMDGHFGNIVRYDFVADHGPGYDDHSAGKIWRYTDVLVTRVPNMPSHMEVDHANRWLYFIDGGPKTIKRLNMNSGSETGNLTVPPTSGEALAGYKRVEGATVETIATWTTQPSGLAYTDGRLLVGDYNTGDIKVYDVTGTPTLVGTIATGQAGMMGLEVGHDGSIWFVNYPENKVVRINSAPLNNDAAITAIVSPATQTATEAYFSTADDVCASSIAPTVTLMNAGANALTSVHIHSSLDDGADDMFMWSGNLAAGASTNVTLPSMAADNGSHVLKVWTMDPNGATDPNAHNDALAGAFRAIAPVQGLPFNEGFAAATFPPAGWNYVHFNPNCKMTRAFGGGFGQGAGSVKMDNYSGDMNITGQLDYLMLPRLDLSSMSSTALEFSVAYALYNTSSVDRLQVKASTDCGETWSVLYDKQGAALSTAPATTGAFTPTATQWRAESVDISSVVGEADVIFAFVSTSNYGNNVYFDDISIGNVVGMEEAGLNEVRVFPVPSNGTVTLRLRNELTGSVLAEVLTIDGKTAHAERWTGASTRSMDLAGLAKGSYVLRLTGVDGKQLRSRLVME
ncbi:MAG: hypothetical protein ABI432_13220 [Flavobacteriales bacterium]